MSSHPISLRWPTKQLPTIPAPITTQRAVDGNSLTLNPLFMHKFSSARLALAGVPQVTLSGRQVWQAKPDGLTILYYGIVPQGETVTRLMAHCLHYQFPSPAF